MIPRTTIFCILILILLSGGAVCEEISVIAVGDMMFGTDVARIMDRDGSLAPFSGTAELLRDADITFGLLEGGIGTRGEAVQDKEHTFRSRPSAARGLANAGFDVVSLATPHIMDYGVDGFVDTMEFLSWYGVKYVGGGMSVTSARNPLIITAKEKRVAFLAYYRGGQFDPLFAQSDKPGPAYPIYGELEKDVSAAKEKADFVIVAIHWGVPVTEDNSITSRQKLYAHRLIDSGADVVLGQWLRRLQGIEIYKGKPIIYSLGDFIYGTYAKELPIGFILRFIFSGEGVFKLELVPLATSDARNASYFPVVLDGKEAQEAIDTISKLSEEFETEIQIKEDIGFIELPKSDD